MAMLQPYPAMKDSGVPWLGQVPAHWQVPRLGSLLRERGETNANGQIQDVLSVVRYRGVIPYAERGNMGNKPSEDITRYKIVKPDDIVVNCMNVIIGSVGLSRYTGCLSPVYYVLTTRSQHDHPRYLNAYFQTKPFQQSLVRIGKGILAHRMRIPMELLKCEPFPKPPPEEQTAIVRYLDHIDRRVTRYIRAKQKLIGRLEEQNQAIVHHAVTRGLDRSIPTKDSGIEWMGEIPEHWDTIRVKSVARFKYGDSLAAHYREDGEVPVYGSNGPVGTHSAANTLGPCIVIGRKGSFGKINYCATPCFAIDTTFFIDSSTTAASMRWLYYALALLGLDSLSEEAAVPGLSRDYAHDQWLPDIPADEQRAIAAYLDNATADIDTAIDSTRREIELVREYRTRLIADVVTGKLDVREAAANLPDQPDEAEPLDQIDDLVEENDTLADDLNTALDEGES